MWQIAYQIAKGAVNFLQNYNSASVQKTQMKMQASSAYYQADVAELNAQIRKEDIYSLHTQDAIQRSQYGQQAQELIAQTRTSAAARGVKGSVGSAAAQTASMQYQAERGLYSMDLQKLSQLHQIRSDVVSYQATANAQRIMGDAYSSLASSINPLASAVAADVCQFLGVGASGGYDSLLSNSTTLQNPATTAVSKQPTNAASYTQAVSSTGSSSSGLSFFSNISSWMSSLGSTSGNVQGF